MMRAADAPSVSGDELPGVMRQSSSGNRSASASVRNAGFSPASDSTEVAGRTVSSTSASTPGTGTTSVAKAPDSPASAARRCDRAANSSSSAAREAPLRGDQLGRDALVHEPLGVARAHARPVGVGARGTRAERHAAHRLDAARDDDVGVTGEHRLRGERGGLLARSALPVDGRARHGLGEARGEHGVAGDVVALLADLADASADHVVDEPGVEVVADDERVEHAGEQVDRMHAGEDAARACRARRACG